MKKTLTLLAAATLGAMSLSAWADTLTVGASNVPHAEILEQAKPILAKQGIDLEIKPFQDYILPNTALASRDIDANYFQHVPYLNSVLKTMPTTRPMILSALARSISSLSASTRRNTNR